MLEIDISQIQSHNPWWQKAELVGESPYLAELKQQKFIYKHPLLKTFPVNKDAVLTLRGPRRIGKTTLLMQLIQQLLLNNKAPISPQNIIYYPADTLLDFKELLELLETYLNYIRPRSSVRIFMFIDEISFVKEWQRSIKLLADQRKLTNATLVITGSNILDLKFSAERMPGRRGEVFPWDIEFLPLTFKQYLQLVAPAEVPKNYLEANANLPMLRKHFADFLLTGGFPITINEFHQKGYLSPQTYEIFLNWIEGDLHQVNKSEEIAYNIFRRLFVHLSSQVSFYKLTRESGLVSHETTQEYLDIFEKMFLTFSLQHFNLEQKKVEPRKNRKFYFTDPFIYNTLKAKLDGFTHAAFRYSKDQIVTEKNLPILVENAVAAYLARQYPQTYIGQTNLGEIDLVGFKEGQYRYYEVKYQKHVQTSEFGKLHAQLKHPFYIITKQNYHEDSINLLPAEAFLAVGKTH